MSAWYNENDPKIAAWLRELIKDGLVAPGLVDERSITRIKPDELTGYTQYHFFAGIGGWSYALRLAGWPDGKEVWTGSCPCQPFSQAGKRKVDSDERHLWPAFRAAISERRPSVVFGEQVASKDGRIWLAGVRADLEALGYAVGAADLCAAGVSAPHPRQRLYWVADANSRGWAKGNSEARPSPAKVFARQSNPASRRMGKPNDAGRKPRGSSTATDGHGLPAIAASGPATRLVNADGHHRQWWSGPMQVGRNSIEGEVERGGRKYRAQWRLKPGLSLLADGVPGRVAQISGFGNAIVPELAAEFIQAYLETKTKG